jgi:hypothetical protein
MTHRTGAGARINADHYFVYLAIVVLVIATGLSGVVMSWSGQLYIAPWLRLPAELAWTVPLALDVPVATLALASLAMKSRGRVPAARWFTAIAIAFTVLSSAANFLYVYDHSHLADYRAWAGAIFKAFAPFITLVMTEVLGALVMRPKPTPRRRKTTKRNSASRVSIPTIPTEGEAL